MDDAKTEGLASSGFPRSHWPKVWSTNPLERVKQGDHAPSQGRRDLSQRRGGDPARRRGAGRHPDEWQSGDRRYLSEGSMALLKPPRDTGTITAIDSGE
jgi:hypothetical protein